MGIFSKKQQLEISDSIFPPAAKQEIMAGRLPQINTDRLFLKPGEVCSYADKAILDIYEKKRVSQHIGRTTRGLFKDSRIGTGITRPIEYEEVKQQKGILYITNKRTIFQAQQHGFDKRHSSLSAIEPYNNAVILQYGQTIYELIVPDGSVVYNVLKLVF